MFVFLKCNYTKGGKMKDNTSKKVKMIIAQECGIDRKSITNKMKFMSNQTLSYFDCMGAMYTLQHKMHVSLPESSYYKYATVGGLVRDITRQLKGRAI